MVELIGDICKPSELTAPNKVTTDLPSAPNVGMIYYDLTTNKLKVWTGTGYEASTSV